jgi:D-amino-acid oxidase
MQQSVAIIGAGVSGLTCGVLFAEAGYRVQISADEIGPRTTSAAAGAVWFPYDAEPAETVIPWALETFDVFRGLCAMPESGVSLIELRQFSRHRAMEIPSWAMPLGARQLAPAFIPESFASGFTVQVPLIDTTRYLDYLAGRFRSATGEICEAYFDHLDEVGKEWSLIVNCAGVGARALIPDPQVEPHRGQVVLVSKTGPDYAVACDDPPLMYAIPRSDDCVFGGTNECSTNRDPDSRQTMEIVAQCRRVLGLDSVKTLGERVGLRPFRRAGVRLAAEQMPDGRRVIHNYGHGGSGFTLSWACAGAVLRLAG